MADGVPGAIRTRGLSLRRRTLYPAELRRHETFCELDTACVPNPVVSIPVCFVPEQTGGIKRRQATFLHTLLHEAPCLSNGKLAER